VAAVTLVLCVVAVHGCVADLVADRLADVEMAAAMPARTEVVYVREMEPRAPLRVAQAAPAAAPVPVPAPVSRPRAVKRPAPAASAEPPALPPEPPASQAAPEPTQESAPPQRVQEPAPEPAAASAPVPTPPPVADAAAPPEPAASAPAPFEWPVSTRVRYRLSGNYRGELDGTAQVEWVRVGMRYEVYLDVTVGLPFAPLMTRRMSSQGRLTAAGLVPQRYDEDSKLAFHDRHRATILFEPGSVLLPQGRRADSPAGVQDAASQFVQMTYWFTVHPELLSPGRSVTVALALPRHVDDWVYDVVGPETLYTPFGAVEAVHLAPRRVARAGGDLTAEIWFAPTLAYLPARIRIRQDADTYIDMVIERKPALAR
jgi:hypothetical protein